MITKVFLIFFTCPYAHRASTLTRISPTFADYTDSLLVKYLGSVYFCHIFNVENTLSGQSVRSTMSFIS